jgi:hypothetical protein
MIHAAIRRLGALLPLVLVLAGCAYLDPWGHRRNLEDAQRAYTRMVRWGDFPRAAQWVEKDRQDRFLDEAHQLSAIRITDYEIGPLEVDGDAATVRVSYRGYHVATLIEGTLEEVQSWVYTDGRWRVRPDLSGLGQGLVGP